MNTHYFSRLENDAPISAPNPSVHTATRGASAPVERGEQIVLTVIRREHRWRFEYEQGEERRLISLLIDLAADDDCSFTWLDVALLSYDILRRIES
ncbi:MAG: hypothetical protein ACOC0P_00290 [Planctomycetota bacterium]